MTNPVLTMVGLMVFFVVFLAALVWALRRWPHWRVPPPDHDPDATVKMPGLLYRIDRKKPEDDDTPTSSASAPTDHKRR